MLQQIVCVPCIDWIVVHNFNLLGCLNGCCLRKLCSFSSQKLVLSCHCFGRRLGEWPHILVWNNQKMNLIWLQTTKEIQSFLHFSRVYQSGLSRGCSCGIGENIGEELLLQLVVILLPNGGKVFTMPILYTIILRANKCTLPSRLSSSVLGAGVYCSVWHEDLRKHLILSSCKFALALFYSCCYYLSTTL